MGEEEKYTNDGEGFIQFLKDNDVYEKFEDMFILSDWNELSIEEYCENIDPEFYIESAFDWEKTEDGQDFWEDVDYIWNSNIN